MMSSMAERVSRKMPAAEKTPSTTAGRTRCRRPPMPPVGNQRRTTPNTRIACRPSQNVGIDWPTNENSKTPRSMIVRRRSAAAMPSGTATPTAITSAADASSAVAGTRSSTRESAGVFCRTREPQVLDWQGLVQAEHVLHGDHLGLARLKRQQEHHWVADDVGQSKGDHRDPHENENRLDQPPCHVPLHQRAPPRRGQGIT